MSYKFIENTLVVQILAGRSQFWVFQLFGQLSWDNQNLSKFGDIHMFLRNTITHLKFDKTYPEITSYHIKYIIPHSWIWCALPLL